MPNTCSIDGCEKPVKARGWCCAHWKRWRRNGDPNAGATAPGTCAKWIQDHAAFSGEKCLLWPFSQDGRGYGAFNGTKAYKAMCILAHGAPPEPTLDAAHSCGVRLCVNPRHLRWATRGENMADKKLHGTWQGGSQHGQSKLTDGDVLEIRKLRRNGMLQREVASLFNVTRETISGIDRGHSWSHLK